MSSKEDHVVRQGWCRRMATTASDFRGPDQEPRNSSYIDTRSIHLSTIMQAVSLRRALRQPRPFSGSHPDLINHLDTSAAPPEVGEYPDATYLNYKPLGLSLCYEPVSASSGSTAAVASTTKQLELAHIDVYNPPANPPARSRRKQAYAGYSTPRLPIRFNFASSSIPLPPRPAPRAPLGVPAKAKPAAAPDTHTHTPTDPETPTILERGTSFDVMAHTTARDFVSHFGEPTKKGEGQTGYVPPFMEWDGLEIVDGDGAQGERGGGEVVKVGIMVELLDPGVPAPPGLGMGGPKGADGGLWDRAADWVWVGLKVFSASSGES